MKQVSGWIKNITMLSQFGLSLITPTLFCVALCWWLTTRFCISYWIYIPGFILGLGSSFMVAYKFYLSVKRRQKKEEKKKASFNQHF